MRVITLILAIFVFCGVASAQSVEQMRQRLSERNEADAFVLVEEDDATASAVRAVENASRATKVSGYRVVIFFNNGQYAGDNANKAMEEFRAKYPNINAYLVYESPYFKVSVGDCLTMEEATILMNSFISDYPKAFPKREDIRLDELYNAPEPEAEIAVDSLVIPAPTTAIFR